jgi:hypothetical protein
MTGSGLMAAFLLTPNFSWVWQQDRVIKLFQQFEYAEALGKR